jgi:hypothetical protein
MELPLFLGCAEDGLFAAAPAVGFVSAMIQLIFGFLKITVNLKVCLRNSTEKCFELAKQYLKQVKKGLQNNYFIVSRQFRFSLSFRASRLFFKDV